MKKLKNINHVRFYKDNITIVTNDLKAIRITVQPQEIKFVLQDIKMEGII